MTAKIETIENWASYDVQGENFYLVNGEHTIMAIVPAQKLNPFLLGKLGREKSQLVRDGEIDGKTQWKYKTERPITYPRKKDLSNTIKTIAENTESIGETAADKLKDFLEFVYKRDKGGYYNEFRIINNLFGVFANFKDDIDRVTLIINRRPAKNYINVRVKPQFVRAFLKTCGRRDIIKFGGKSDYPLTIEGGGRKLIIAPLLEE